MNSFDVKEEVAGSLTRDLYFSSLVPRSRTGIQHRSHPRGGSHGGILWKLFGEEPLFSIHHESCRHKDPRLTNTCYSSQAFTDTIVSRKIQDYYETHMRRKSLKETLILCWVIGSFLEFLREDNDNLQKNWSVVGD
jgi:hypothetical protein